jgi:hypothetical protein
MMTRSGPIYRKWLRETAAGHRRTALRLERELRELETAEDAAAV